MTANKGDWALCDTHTLSATWRMNIGQNTAVRPSRYFHTKAILGRVLAALLLIPALPIMAVLCLLIRSTSPGPAIYRQTRVGRNGRVYRMLKLRTMRSDAEARTGAVWTVQNDPRITRLGRVLRKLHLDEFPQLFNVVCGEMSLVGPRPERPEFVYVLGKEIPEYWDRLMVPPGITGLAQINLPPDTDLDSVRRKLQLDLAYIHEAGFLLDIRILFCTLLRAIGLNGILAMQICRLRRDVALPAHHAASGETPSGRAVMTPAAIAALLQQSKPDADEHHSDAKDGNGDGRSGRGESSRKRRSTPQRA